MRVSNGFDLTTRERVLSVDDAEGTNPAFWLEFHDTPAWKRFTTIYAPTSENFERIVDILNKMYAGQKYFTFDEVKHVFDTAIHSGGSVNDPLDRIPVQVDVPVQESERVPLGRNGKPLSASQIAWGEMTRWSESATSAQIAERRRTDPAFASFYHTNLVRSFEEVGDGVVEQNPHLLSQAAPTTAALKDERLVAFARRYSAMSSAEVRAARSKAINPLSADQFEKDLNEAIRLNLI
jgi:hypothetical protein